MSRNVHIFNIDHDLALASNLDNYVPAKVAIEMNDDLESLPIWWAENGDFVVCDKSAVDESLLRSLSVDVSLGMFDNLKLDDKDNVMVWGWNRTIAKKVSKLNRCVEVPNIDDVRFLSSRARTIDILNAFVSENLYPKEMLPRQLFSLSEVEAIVESKDILLKAPFSGSGRGLWWALNGFDFNVQRWSNKVIREQSSVMAEKIWSKKSDYAAEFYSNGKDVSFVGYSCFLSDSAGVYRTNRLVSNSEIRKKIIDEIGSDVLDVYIRLLENLLTDMIAGKYKGYLGVDMLTADYRGHIILNPCVEVNLRMTMGAVARIFYDRFVADDAVGDYSVINFRNHDDFTSHVNKMRDSYPLVIKENKIQQGYVLLSSVKKNTKHGVEVLLKA